MSSQATPYGVDEVRQANRLFLDFLRANPGVAAEDLGLSGPVIDVLLKASATQIERTAAFPRALFRLNLPPRELHVVVDARELKAAPHRRALQIVLLQNAWTVSRTSAYSARLLLRLDDDAIERLRRAELRDILLMSLADDLLRAAFDDLDWIWEQLLTESRPELRRRLLLLGLQPELALLPAPA